MEDGASHQKNSDSQAKSANINDKSKEDDQDALIQKRSTLQSVT